MNSQRSYRITVRGRLGERLASAFDGMTVEYRGGNTILSGAPVDQARLHGLLARIRDFGLDLVRVEEAGE